MIRRILAIGDGGEPGEAGVSSLNSLTGDVNIIAGDNITIDKMGNSLVVSAEGDSDDSGRYLVSGGAVWSGTGLIYDVSMLTYVFDGETKTAAQTQVTLDPSDSEHNRIDAITVDEDGTISVVTGDPSSSPISPVIGEDSILVQFILVEAGTIEPQQDMEAIYLDVPTTNWNNTTVSTRAGVDGTVDFSSTDSPKQGAHCVKATTTGGYHIAFRRNSAFDVHEYETLQIWVRLDMSFVGASVRVRFEKPGGGLYGNTIGLNSYGIDVTDQDKIGQWQLAMVPVNRFTTVLEDVQGLRVYTHGNNTEQYLDFSIDNIVLSTGSLPVSERTEINFFKDGDFVGAQEGLDLIEGDMVTITPVNDVLNNKVSYRIDAAPGESEYYVWDTTLNSGFIGTDAIDRASNTTGEYSMFIGVMAGMYNEYQGITPLDASNSNFIGYRAGGEATNASNSNFFGNQSGYGAVSASNSNFFGNQAGWKAGNAYDSNFFGNQAGYLATEACYSNFIGNQAGQGATNAYESNFTGFRAGENAMYASKSNFTGYQAGRGAERANQSNFFGNRAGENALYAESSNFIGYEAGLNAFTTTDLNTTTKNANFIGYQAGYEATDAHNSSFIGHSAGYQAYNAGNSIFIGRGSGNEDTVDNNSNPGDWSILIGNETNTGGFSNSIVLGAGSTNTASDQFMLGSNIDHMVIPNPKTPASSTDTGTKGTIMWDSDYIYVATDTDTWKRVALTTF